MFQLIISSSSVQTFMKRIGFHHTPKKYLLSKILKKLKNQIKYSKFTTIVSKIMPSKEEIDIYGCTEATHGFKLLDYNGFYV